MSLLEPIWPITRLHAGPKPEINMCETVRGRPLLNATESHLVSNPRDFSMEPPPVFKYCFLKPRIPHLLTLAVAIQFLFGHVL